MAATGRSEPELHNANTAASADLCGVSMSDPNFDYAAALARPSNIQKHVYAVEHAITSWKGWDERENPQCFLQYEHGKIKYAAPLTSDTALMYKIAELFLPWARVFERELRAGIRVEFRRKTENLLHALTELTKHLGASHDCRDIAALYAAVVVVSRVLLLHEAGVVRALSGTVNPANGRARE